MATTYYTHAAPGVAAGFLMQAESTLRMGTAYLYGSLENTSWTYATYEASVGLVGGSSFDVGLVASIGIDITAEVEGLESANVQDATIFMVTGEEAILSVGIQQFDTRVLEMALATGVMYSLGDERLITFGGGCNIKSRPVSIDASNVGCDAPSTDDVDTGITLIVVTLYDVICTSGLPWDDIQAGEINTIDLEFTARPVVARSRGNRLGNIYIA